MSLDDLAQRLAAAERKVAGLDLDGLAIRQRKLAQGRRLGWLAGLAMTNDPPPPGPPVGDTDCILRFLGCTGGVVPGVKATVTFGGQQLASLTSDSNGQATFRGYLGAAHTVAFSRSRFLNGSASVTITEDDAVKIVQMSPATGYFCFKDCPIPIFNQFTVTDPIGSATVTLGLGAAANLGLRTISGVTMASTACAASVTGTAQVDYRIRANPANANALETLYLNYRSCNAFMNGNIKDGSNPNVGDPFTSILEIASAAPDSYTCAPFSATWTFTGGNTLKVFGADPATVTLAES